MGLFDNPEDTQRGESGLFKLPQPRSDSRFKPKAPKPVTAPGVPSVPGVGATPAAPSGKSELPPIFGLGQGALKGLLTPWAATIGATNELLKGNTDLLGAAGKNVESLWGPQDIFEPGAWDDLVTGETIASERLKLPEVMFKLNTPGIDIPIGTSTFWAGLGLDIALDPLSYGGVTGVPGAIIKGGISATRSAAKGGRLAAQGEVAAKLAAGKVDEPIEIFNERRLGNLKKLERDGLQGIRNNIIKVDPKATKVVEKAEAKILNNTYKTVKVTDPRPASQAIRDVVVSGLDAGKKAFSNTLVASNTAKFLQQYAKRDVRRFPTRGLVTSVVKNSDTGGFSILSGNKVVLAEAATKAEADKLAKDLRKGLAQATDFAPVAAMATVREVATEGEQAVVLPSVDGAEVTIESMVPHQADNGKVYVYDGENIAEFENIQDANNWVDIMSREQTPAGLDVAVSGTKGKYQVRVGENVTRFTTKRDAEAYAQGVRTGEIPGARRVTTGGTPIVDAPPAPIPLKEVLEAPTPKEASALKAVLQGVENVAKKVSGWRPQVNKSVANQIRQALGAKQAQLDAVLIKANPGQLAVIKEFIEDPSNAKGFFADLNSTNEIGRQLATEIGNIRLQSSKGAITLTEALSVAKGKFLNLSKAVDGVEGSGLEAQALSQIKARFYERAQQLKTRKVLPANTPEGKYQAIIAVAGQEIADRIQKTGFLTQPTKASKEKVENILEQISVGSTEVSYQGYDDLIAGLQRGDEISANALEEIVNLIDPEGAIRTQVVQAAAEPASAYLTRLLTREGGVNSIYDAERRLALANDPEMLAKHSGLAYPAEVAAMMKLAVSENKAVAGSIEFASTKQAFATKFAEEYPLDVQRNAMDSYGRSLMGDPKKGGAGGRQAYKASIVEEATGEVTTSSLGDYIYRTGEAYADDSRALFAKQLTQSDEIRALNSLMGKLSWRQGEGKKVAAEKGVRFDPKTPEEKLDYLITHAAAGRDGMGGLGFRFSRNKNRSDVQFEKSYQSAIQKAKDTKTTPNFSALELKHTAYLPMADILDALRSNGALQGLLKGYFPTGNVNLKRDVMDWYGLGDAARRVIEMDSAGEVFDLNEITQRILRRGEGRLEPSDRRLQIFEQAAKEIAEVLTEPQVVAQLRGVHLDNAASIVKDFMNKAEDYSKELFDVLDEAWVNMHAADNISEAVRMDKVRLFMRKFVIASDIMRLEGGPIAEAMFRASAFLFADGGRVLPEGKISQGLTNTEKEFYNLLRNDEMTAFREALTKWYRYADLPAAPLGREGMAPPKKAAKAKAQAELDTVMEVYAKHMEQLKTVERTGDLNLIKQWEKQMVRIQTKLDKARETAWNNWVPTFHWHPTDGWVPTAQFDHARATVSARNVHAQYVAGKQGVADREMFMADTAPVIPPHKVLSAAEKAKFLKKHRVAMTNHLVNNAASTIDDIARNVADEIEAGYLDSDDLNGADKMMIANQNIDARSLKESTEIRLFTAAASYKDRLPDSDIEFNRIYRPLLNEDTPVLTGDRTAVKLKLMAQQWSATTRGTSDVMSMARGVQNRSSQVIADYATAMDSLSKTMTRANQQDIDAVWTAMRDDLPLAADEVPIRLQIEKDLAPFVNGILKSEATSVLTQNGLDGAALSQVFARYGLDESIGFPSVRELQGKTAEELVASLFNDLPFGNIPPKLKSGSTEAIQWAKRKDRFLKSNMPAPLAFSRMFSAIQQLKGEQGIAHNMAAQFGWKAHYATKEQAIKAGYVQIEAAGKDSIARFLPDPDNGGLFHPTVAEDMSRVFREWNAIYEGKALNAFLRGSMQVMGFFKFTQTTSRLGHHVVNIVGDGSTMLLFGWKELSPATMIDGGDLANRYTRVNAAADYSKLQRDFEAKYRRIANGLAGMPNAKPITGGSADTVKFTFYKNGKPSMVGFDREEFSADLGARGIFVPGFVQGDIMNATNDIMLTGTTAGKKRSLQKIWSKVARPGHEYMKALSTATSAYSNVIRGTTAMRVAQSRSWNSYEDMMNAIVKEVNLIHPTVQSLASAEKRTGRLLFTYYTWLRVAHNAMWDLAVNHTGAFLAVPKAQYNFAQMQGFDPQSPAVPFENQNVLPDYLSYSVYGPTAMNEQGPRVNRPPLMQLDVLDFWKVWYDPSKPLGQNVANIGGQVAGNVIGPSLNILGQPIAETLFNSRSGADISTEQIADDTFRNFGFYNLLVGLGAHTPYRYRNPDTTNPLTDADRQRTLDNWLQGSRAQDLYRPINVKLGQSQYGRRVKDYNENVQQENLRNAQNFVDDRLSEGYTPDQIKDMLKGLGLR